jgi:flagellar hook-basal body complex protein FliE
MTVDALNAVNAYRNQLKIMQGAGSASEDSSSPSPFMQMVENAAKNVVDVQSKSEAAQMQSMTGKGELTDLVTAVASAELTLNTVVAIRDRVINAYNDIIKMPI